MNKKYIVIHCSAGFGNVESIKRYWKEVHGWKSPGYCRIIDLDGTVHELASYSSTTNGVKGFNTKSIHICYIGGVENVGTKQKPIWKAKDTRTKEQKIKLLIEIVNVKKWIHENGGDINDVLILGHRDFSRDLNANNIIEPWERIKECPSYDARFEYTFLNPSQLTKKLPQL